MMVGAASVLMTSCGDDEENVPTGDNPEQTDPSTDDDNPVPGDGSDTHEYVDLGLPSGTLWATCNIGASSPEEYGDYFAWGETEPKSDYSWITYKWCNGSYNSLLTKYCTESTNGIVDDKTQLELEDDAAYVNWGNKWRIPGKTQFSELFNSNYTTTEWVTQNGVLGCKTTSRTNGNSIFLPAAGYRDGTSLKQVGSIGEYWTCAFYYRSQPRYARFLYFSSEYHPTTDYTDARDRCRGLSVRPVCMSN